MILISYYPSQSVWWKKGCLETETWKQEKKKTPSLVLLVNMVVEETWPDRGVTLDTSASEIFLHRSSYIINSVHKTKLPRADRTTTPRKTSIKNMN